MYRGYQFIIAHIVMRCCTVESQIATYQLSVYHVLYQDPKGELCLMGWLEMSWRFWKVMHRDLKCSNLLLDVSGRVTWRNILLASMTTTFPAMWPVQDWSQSSTRSGKEFRSPTAKVKISDFGCCLAAILFCPSYLRSIIYIQIHCHQSMLALPTCLRKKNISMRYGTSVTSLTQYEQGKNRLVVWIV